MSDNTPSAPTPRLSPPRRWGRPLGGAAALLGAVLLVVAAPPFRGAPGAPTSRRARQLEALRNEHARLQAEAKEALRNARTEAERRAAWAKAPRPAAYVARALKIVRADPKDDVSFEALRWALAITRGADRRVAGRLAKYHARNPGMNSALRPRARRPHPGLAGLLRKVLAENPDEEARGLACFALGNLAVGEVNRGKESAAPQAERFFARAAREFPDVRLGRTTLGDACKRALFELRHLRVGKTPPDVMSRDLRGKRVRLRDYRGKVVVLDFWATWCGPCRAMIPHERAMVARFKGQPFAFISISADSRREALAQFLRKQPMPWEHWWEGPEGRLLKEWNVHSFPTSYVLDARGVVRYRNVRGQELEKAVETLLREAKR